MKRIVEIVPARPGWYSRWQIGSGATRCYPVSLWALVEEADGSAREVVGMDCAGQWPGSEDNESGGGFVRYLFQLPDSGSPEDVEPPSSAEPRSTGPRRQPVVMAQQTVVAA
ncbi:hypothetical protein ACIG87_02555 [Micromonospora sp. NPDC051925]|uniref:hypothetical protein n=1 Tax=Micromonospora sp. NPDC051925 TaxID=3364288 RepID=UPI0037C9A80E